MLLICPRCGPLLCPIESIAALSSPFWNIRIIENHISTFPTRQQAQGDQSDTDHRAFDEHACPCPLERLPLLTSISSARPWTPKPASTHADAGLAVTTGAMLPKLPGHNVSGVLLQ